MKYRPSGTVVRSAMLVPFVFLEGHTTYQRGIGEVFCVVGLNFPSCEIHTRLQDWQQEIHHLAEY